MFGNRKSRPTPFSVDQESFATLIGRQTSIQGEIQIQESIRIDGHLRGHVCGAADQAVAVVISASGHVEGDITARRVVVAGKVSGHIQAIDRVELHAGCLVQGDIRYGSIAIEHGARVLGLLLQVDEAQTTLTHDTQAAIQKAQGSFTST
jgi:cytoskeletal protein CcmA (bactofilin family)